MQWVLRAKLLLSVGCIIFIVLGTSTLMHIRATRRDYLDAIGQRSEALAQGILTDILIAQEESPYGMTSIRMILKQLSQRCLKLYEFYQKKDITHIAIIDPYLQVITHTQAELSNTRLEDPVLKAALERREQVTILEQTTYHTLLPIFLSEDVYLGTIDIGVPKHIIDAKIKQLLVYSGGLFGLFLVLAFLAVLGLIQVLIRKPIRKLVAVGEKIARGELEDSFQATQGNEVTVEIRALAGVFHQMIDYLQAMARVATRIAIGDLSQNVTPRSDNDVLGMAFQRMASYLKNMATVARKIADRDLCQDVQPTTEHDVLGNAFSQMGMLRHAIRHIMEDADQVRQASQALSEISVQMASDAEQTSQEVQTVSLSSQHMSENMAAVAAATEQMSISIREISHHTVDVMNGIHIAVEMAEAANLKILDLESSSREIGDIIKVITTITQQTNLLALNASIEAARAGDFGKGFAVVADEVKGLAREIASSAQDITHKVEAMQARSKDAMEAIKKVSESIHQVYDFSHSISSAAEQQSISTNEISHSIAEASQGSSELATAIAEVANVTQHTKARARHVQEAAEGLAALADQLQQQVGTFMV